MAVVLAAIAFLAGWTAIEYAMKIAKFTPLFIKWRYAEQVKSLGTIVTGKPRKDG